VDLQLTYHNYKDDRKESSAKSSSAKTLRMIFMSNVRGRAHKTSKDAMAPPRSIAKSVDASDTGLMIRGRRVQFQLQSNKALGELRLKLCTPQPLPPPLQTNTNNKRKRGAVSPLTTSATTTETPRPQLPIVIAECQAHAIDAFKLHAATLQQQHQQQHPDGDVNAEEEAPVIINVHVLKERKDKDRANDEYTVAKSLESQLDGITVEELNAVFAKRN
jgi:hypothetical protein